MEKTNKKCNGTCNCSHADAKKIAQENLNDLKSAEKVELTYSFYSKVLGKPFDSLSELKAAEDTYYNELKIKEDAAAQKKADALKVEDAFKALNAARKSYKEDLAQLTKEFSEELDQLKKAFELGKSHCTKTLADAEDAYAKALKEFTTKYNNYHMTLKDGDFETTISSNTSTNKTAAKTSEDVFDLFKWIFGI